jgi:CheY-like chemotaxis protein
MKILIAEDDKYTALLYKEALEKRGQQVIISNTGQQCLEIYNNCGALHTISDRQGQTVTII